MIAKDIKKGLKCVFQSKLHTLHKAKVRVEAVRLAGPGSVTRAVTVSLLQKRRPHKKGYTFTAHPYELEPA